MNTKLQAFMEYIKHASTPCGDNVKVLEFKPSVTKINTEFRSLETCVQRGYTVTGLLTVKPVTPAQYLCR